MLHTGNLSTLYHFFPFHVMEDAGTWVGSTIFKPQNAVHMMSAGVGDTV